MPMNSFCNLIIFLDINLNSVVIMLGFFASYSHTLIIIIVIVISFFFSWDRALLLQVSFYIHIIQQYTSIHHIHSPIYCRHLWCYTRGLTKIPVLWYASNHHYLLNNSVSVPLYFWIIKTILRLKTEKTVIKIQSAKITFYIFNQYCCTF